MSSYVLPRMIMGNRGDLASRWGVLQTLHQLGNQQVAVFCRAQEDVPALPYPTLPYGPVKNFLHTRAGWRALRRADTVLWSVGLDLQDDSSLSKVLYLLLNFAKYRLMGLKILVLFQGAGPLTTAVGRTVVRTLLGLVDTFLARDPGTAALIRALGPQTKCVQAYDAIFLPGFEKDLAPGTHDHPAIKSKLVHERSRPTIGINLRQWFHFSSSILPYQFSKEKYRLRSQANMQLLLEAYRRLVELLIQRLDANILLISAYQPGIVPWEDDLEWLAQLKGRFAANERVLLVDDPLTMPEYYQLMAHTDLMIGMRLHSSLIALRFGVPSLNISYTLKGHDILNHMGLADSVISLADFLEEPEILYQRSEKIIQQQAAERNRITQIVRQAVSHNVSVLQAALQPA